MVQVGFEPTIPVFKRSKIIHALGHVAIGTDIYIRSFINYLKNYSITSVLQLSAINNFHHKVTIPIIHILDEILSSALFTS